ncbi:outer membrane beta-barrel protein [Dyadobacter fermentans]|uniref:Outer membrane protein beta-barrel domain-containing protein n=1 Tax=Dyadobacter fermentans (strain ATCC 700827 / DSM 18053 / CIP 107007 / KCTC 52180 / NS114) TaxID=471854 RepID=C6VT04_DYAFD|nr:outer membrane beta-barrel protein [Dyadobacter fermentans]ACT94649.1 hypothetical protein Dfer_3439 [Dyadobacter fermentans DSM 18053]
MKSVSFFFLICFLIFSQNVFAQQGEDSLRIDESINIPPYKNLKKGALTFSLNGSANNSEQKAGWSLTPQAGYLIADRLVVGLQLSIANRFSKERRSWASLKPGGVKEYAFTPEVYARYYLLPFRFTPYFQLSTGYNFGKFTARDDFFDRKISVSTNNYVMFGAVGLSVRVGKYMGLQAQYNLPIIVDSQKNEMIRDNRFRLGLSFYFK